MDIENATFRGKKIADMDRADLLKLIDYLYRDHAARLSPDVSRANALGRVEMIRRGEIGTPSTSGGGKPHPRK